jgi:hypothetical protein
LDKIGCVVIGAGVVGLATARALALAGQRVLVLERAYTVGFETSSRNSEVIHGGLYYPAGSLKARCWVAGRERVYAYCREHGVPHAQIGKLIVAGQESEIAGIERITNAARANGVDDLQWLTATQAQRLGPGLRCVAALLSPSTGIVDSHTLMLTFQGEAEAAGAMVVLCTPVLSGRVRADGLELAIGGEEPTAIRVAASSIQPGSMRPPSPAQSTGCRGIRSRLPLSVGALIFRWPVVHRFSDSFTGPSRRVCAASTSPSIWRGKRASARMSSGFLGLITRSIEGVPTRSMPRSAPTGPNCGTARYSPAMLGSGRRSADPRNRPSISACRGRNSVAYRG